MKRLIGMLLFVVALLWVILGVKHALAEPLTMTECFYRGEIALKIQRVVDGGKAISEIELTSPEPAKDEAEAAANAKFYADFLAEIAAAEASIDSKLEQYPERIAQRIIENCAYQVGLQTKADTEHQREVHAEQQANMSPAEALYVLASKLSKLPMHDEPPHMTLISHADLLAKCKRNQPALMACQFGDEILLDGSVNWHDIKNQSILVHEFVHHLQYASNGSATSCVMNVDREIEAYRVQNEFLSRLNHETIQPPSFAGVCEEK